MPAARALAITVVAATNGWHQLVIASGRLAGHPPLVVLRAGPAFWLHSAYCYLLLAAGMFGVLRARRTATGGRNRVRFADSVAA